MSRTQKQIEASRRNGSKSKGPKSARGKAVSSQNAHTLGLHSTQLCLPTEDPQSYDRLLADFTNRLAGPAPLDSVDQEYIEQLVTFAWKRRRYGSIQKGHWQQSIQSVLDQHPGKQWNGLELTLAADALLRASNHPTEALDTAELRLSRAFHQAMRALLLFRKS